jgi:DNA polymerase-3 subunit delta'
MAGFHDIIGHEKIKEHLQKAIGYQRVSHAYILSGEEGMGRKTIAKAFAMTLLCEKHGTEPCMECHSCKQFLSGNHPDVIWVTHEKPASIGVDDVRIQINDTVSIRPYSSPYKIYLVDEAEKMTVQAQNALLKTIEEPPAYAVLVLITTNPEVFLPTILSRCIQLKLRPLKDSVVSDYLTEKMGVSDGQADIYAAFARGNLGKAIYLASSEEFALLYREVLTLLKNIKDMDIPMLLDYIRKLQEDNLVINIRGKGNFISERNPGASMPGLEVTQHPVRCTLSGSIDETEMEFRIEPPTESISQNLKRKTAVVVIADRWYKSAGKACAYSLSFIPIEVISGKQIDLREKEDLFQYLEHGVYEDAVSSTCQLSYTTTGNFTAVKYMLSQHASFILVQETLYDENSRVLVSSKHYIPVESFKTQVNAVAGRA